MLDNNAQLLIKKADSLSNLTDEEKRIANELKAENAKKELWKSIAKKIKYKTISKTDGQEIIGRVQSRLDYTDYDKVDIVIEAVVENMKVKKSIFKELEESLELGVA